MTQSSSALTVALIMLGAPAALNAQSVSNLLLVVNSSSPTSEAVAKHYIAKRGVPQDNVCSIQVAATETISTDVTVKFTSKPAAKMNDAERSRQPFNPRATTARTSGMP